jgi:hypothetical protein
VTLGNSSGIWFKAVFIAKGRGHRAEGRREKIEGLRFQYLARVLIALATAILPHSHPTTNPTTFLNCYRTTSSKPLDNV